LKTGQKRQGLKQARRLAVAMLLGLPLEELLDAEDEIANLRPRVERLRRRFGLPGPPGKRKADAA